MESSNVADVEVTRIGGERWISVHIYYEKESHEILREIIPAVVTALFQDRSISSFFFVRYWDEHGPHVRLRLQLEAAGARVCLDRVLEAGADRFRIIPSPFEPEIERYGGQEALSHSLAFFALSSAHSLAFEREFGELPRSRQMTLALCFLLWQAWGFARDEPEFRGLLSYFSIGLENHPEMVALARETFQRNGSRLTELVGRELQRLIALDATMNKPVCLNSASSLVTSARALSISIESLEPAARWSVGSSQMHMTANRLGLTNLQETYVTQLLRQVLQEIIATDPNLWLKTRELLERSPQIPGTLRNGIITLRQLVRSHIMALSTQPV